MVSEVERQMQGQAVNAEGFARVQSGNRGSRPGAARPGQKTRAWFQVQAAATAHHRRPGSSV